MSEDAPRVQWHRTCSDGGGMRGAMSIMLLAMAGHLAVMVSPLHGVAMAFAVTGGGVPTARALRAGDVGGMMSAQVLDGAALAVFPAPAGERPAGHGRATARHDRGSSRSRVADLLAAAPKGDGHGADCVLEAATDGRRAGDGAASTANLPGGQAFSAVPARREAGPEAGVAMAQVPIYLLFQCLRN
jgi:hypothetical protein